MSEMRPLLARWAPARLSCSGSVHPTTVPSALRNGASAAGLSFFCVVRRDFLHTTKAPTGYISTDLMAQLHTGTVMRAMFAGGIALWSKAATIAKVRTSPAPGRPVAVGTLFVFAIPPR